MKSETDKKTVKATADEPGSGFEKYFLRHHCRHDLKLIYKHCWPNEHVGPKSLISSTKSAKNIKAAQERWTSFGRESWANMLKFSRFFGL